ncbi:MAG: SUMF1/EgtB/PvdO family nonheme iron enzyme, partial [Planctomycetes bacterium]|nr:SUMF1/EgtB/PvdO family nonheme iron enzyme [Planctomycetota bacterium]
FGTSRDCNNNSIPDECDIASGASEDCNGNGLADECDTFGNGDFNGDHAVGLDDYLYFADCMVGPNQGPQPSSPGCVDACLAAFDLDGDGDVDMIEFALFQQGMTGPAGPAVVIDTTPVGNPGNANDTHGDGYGGVAYTYNIGKYEVTAGQYAEFLNAVAGVDTYRLYSTEMWSSVRGCKVERFGGGGTKGDPYQYRVASDWADRPVNYVSWGDAARFSNWLHNGQPTGAQNLTTTEDGSYFLIGAMTNAELLGITRALDATWVIPSEDEWYKAAYHYNDGVTGNYFDYPMSSDSVPSNDLEDPDPGNNATFYDSGYTIGSPYNRTELGAHQNSDSPYGTFDQAGNVYEWNEAILYGSYRGLRGGSFDSNGRVVQLAEVRTSNDPSEEAYLIGFRVAEVP